MKKKEEKPVTYFSERMKLLGITEADNLVEVWQTVAGENKLVEVPIFKESEQGIKIYVTTLDRLQIPFAKEGARWKNDRYHITRLATPRVKANGDTMKYDIPKGQGTYPFFHPRLIHKFEQKIKIDSLFITEGFFKAFKGCHHGLDVVGVSSITHLKDKETGKLHGDILRLIKTCSVKRVVWLTDGDCLNITHKEITEQTDLYKRPKSFFSSATTFQQLLSDFDVEKWFAHIASEEIEGNPKGLDDMLCILKPEDQFEAVADLLTFGKSSAAYKYCTKADITYGTHKLLKYFNLDSVNNFYLYHAERRADLKEKEFVWNGTHYKWDPEKNECKVMVPAEASDYFRVGDQYHKFVEIPNKYKELEKTFHRRQKGTILDDHGKTIFQHIPKYDAFCNVPDHLNYQQINHNTFNVYAPFEHEPAEEDCTEEDVPNIISFIKHIFGSGQIEWKNPKMKIVDGKLTQEKKTINEFDLGLDYIQLMYQKPTQILPILCLVSRENGTGKSTFAKLLKLIFTANCAIVGNAELADNFNASWASKLLIICDEAKIDKQIVVEKVKSLSTADKILMNAKGKDHVEIDFFGKFIFLSNFEDNFLYATDDDVRYWIRKVPVIRDLKVDMLEAMIDEIPAFLSYLNKRKLATEYCHRGWFDPSLLKTDALKRVVAHSAPTIVKELRQFFRDKFFDFGQEEIYMTRQDIHNDCFNKKYEVNYLEDVLKEKFGLDTYHEYEYLGKNFGTIQEAEDYAEAQGKKRDEATLTAKKVHKLHRYSYPRWEEKKMEGGGSDRIRVHVKGNGRHYIIPRSKFLSPEEVAGLHIDSEQAFITDNVTNAENGTTPKVKVTDEDLPF